MSVDDCSLVTIYCIVFCVVIRVCSSSSCTLNTHFTKFLESKGLKKVAKLEPLGSQKEGGMCTYLLIAVNFVKCEPHRSFDGIVRQPFYKG